jgi:hypothetical protein
MEATEVAQTKESLLISKNLILKASNSNRKTSYGGHKMYIKIAQNHFYIDKNSKFLQNFSKKF